MRTEQPADIPDFGVLCRFAEAVANAREPIEAFRAAETATKSLIGHGLFTVMAFDPDAMEVARLFSSHPAEYPPGGRKRKRDTAWGHQVLEQGQFFIGANADDIRANFDDHEVILGMGLNAILNVPIRRLGRTVGTMNLLDRTPHYRAIDARTGAVIAMGLAGFIV